MDEEPRMRVVGAVPERAVGPRSEALKRSVARLQANADAIKQVAARGRRAG